MAELTDEQVRRAQEAFGEMYDHQKGLGVTKNNCEIAGLYAAASFLQFPWREPTEKEFEEIYEKSRQFNDGHLSFRCVLEFVRIRNAALLPKPVDPRRAIIKDVLMDCLGRAGMPWDEICDKLTARLDEVK